MVSKHVPEKISNGTLTPRNKGVPIILPEKLLVKELFIEEPLMDPINEDPFASLGPRSRNPKNNLDIQVASTGTIVKKNVREVDLKLIPLKDFKVMLTPVSEKSRNKLVKKKTTVSKALKSNSVKSITSMDSLKSVKQLAIPPSRGLKLKMKPSNVDTKLSARKSGKRQIIESKISKQIVNSPRKRPTPGYYLNLSGKTVVDQNNTVSSTKPSLSKSNKDQNRKKLPLKKNSANNVNNTDRKKKDLAVKKTLPKTKINHLQKNKVLPVKSILDKKVASPQKLKKKIEKNEPPPKRSPRKPVVTGFYRQLIGQKGTDKPDSAKNTLIAKELNAKVLNKNNLKSESPKLVPRKKYNGVIQKRTVRKRPANYVKKTLTKKQDNHGLKNGLSAKKLKIVKKILGHLK